MVLIAVILFLCLVNFVITDPCYAFENLLVDSTRSPSHVESVYGNKNCDITLSEKWYRLLGDAGTDLTNDSSLLVPDGCGTLYQLWMNGPVPDVSDDIVDRQICMRSVFSNCHSSFTVQVKNCCSFRVYNLKSATGCPAAYCVSPSSVPSVDCPTTTTEPTTTAEDTTTSVSTTTETNTRPKTITGYMHVAIVNTSSNEILIAVVVLMLVIAVTVLGAILYKTYKGNKVNTVEQPTDRQHQSQYDHIESNNPHQVGEKDGFNNCAPANTQYK